MAKVDNNIFVRGLSGSLGDQFTVRKGKGGRTIVAAKPNYSGNREYTTVQLKHQDAFREAIAYARRTKDQQVYVDKATGTTMTSFNAAVADWFNKPQVLQIDGDQWTGGSGQTIGVKAMDDTQVTRVHVIIMDDSERLLEEGDAVQGEGLWWDYTTTVPVPEFNLVHLIAEAHDLPGNRHSMGWSPNN